MKCITITLLALIGCTSAKYLHYVKPVAPPIVKPVRPVAVLPNFSRIHIQNNRGNYHYGYHDGFSAKYETKTDDGVVRGSYSYIDANGVKQTVKYTSDAVNGFRVVATNLPKPLAASDCENNGEGSKGSPVSRTAVQYLDSHVLYGHNIVPYGKIQPIFKSRYYH